MTPTPATVNTTGTFFDTRYVYNVVKKTAHPASFTNQYKKVLRLVGVQTAANGGAGFICSGSANLVINIAGFVPIPLRCDRWNRSPELDVPVEPHADSVI